MARRSADCDLQPADPLVWALAASLETSVLNASWTKWKVAIQDLRTNRSVQERLRKQAAISQRWDSIARVIGKPKGTWPQMNGDR
jgi:hypothetical protein